MADAHAVLSTVVLRLGDPQSAVRLAEKAVDLDSEDPRAFFHLGRARGGRGDLRGAIRAYDRALELDPRNAAALLNRGADRHALQEYEEAEADFREAVRLAPHQPLCHFNLGNALWSLGRREEAVAAYETAGKMRAPRWLLLQARWRRAACLGELGRFEEEIEVYGEIVRIDPMCANAYSDLGTRLLLLGRHAQARGSLEKAIEIDPRHLQAHRNLADVLRELCDYEAAAVHAKRLLALEETSTAHANHADALLHTGAYDAALAACADALRLDAGDAWAHELRLDALLAQGRHEEALRACTDAIGLVSGRPGWSLGLRRVGLLRVLGPKEEATELARRLLRSAPADLPAYTTAYLHAAAGDATRARDLLRKLESRRKASDAYGMSQAYAILGDADDALRMLRQALEGGTVLPPGAAPDPDFSAMSQDPAFLRVHRELTRTR